jgi:flagellar protein FlaI
MKIGNRKLNFSVHLGSSSSGSSKGRSGSSELQVETPIVTSKTVGTEGYTLDTKFLAGLPEELQVQSQKHRHLGAYLSAFSMDDLGIPEYNSRLSRSSKKEGKRNLVYPVGQGVFIHIYHDPDDTRDFYVALEPSSAPEVETLMEEVDRRLMDYIDELRTITDKDERVEVLLGCLDRICTTNGKGGKGGFIQVSQDQYEGLRYMMKRDKGGMGVMEPLISDPYIEDISCSGVGSLFLEHKIFGGLKSNITFDTMDVLDKYVIQLSEKIARPVTIREPIVDATLPDGSRINIVYGGDVSRRGSNFTIRKFNAIPFSILDLVESGSLTYEMAAYISLMLGEGMNIFVSGETASGKTTMLNAISTFIPPNSKIVSIEDTPELQVPHQNWTREVVRGGGETSSSVTMFDLLVAALRQRPNEIIIGEIRGVEGAIAFQAMQTGHACMATFHASSVEKLIQRLTGNPINVPKTYMDNLNMVIIMSAVRLPDGTPARRVLSINEIVEYDPASDSFGFIEVFRWDPSTDTFEFPGYMNTYILEQVVASKRGLPPHETRRNSQKIEGA